MTDAQDLSITFTSTPAAADPGQTTSATVTVATSDGKPFASSVTFSCPTQGLPTGVTCNLPATITAGTSSPQTGLTVTLNTAGPFTGAAGGIVKREPTKLRSQNQRLWLPLGLPLAGIMFVGFAGKRIPRLFQILGMGLALIVAGFLIACGGSSSPPPPVVSISPDTAQMFPNLVVNGQSGTAQTQQFNATVSNTTNETVTWAVNGTAGGSATVGTVSVTGLYTAPATNPGGTITVTATSTLTTTPGSATVTLETPTPAVNNQAIAVTVTEGSVSNSANFNLTVN